ncbi:MAG: histidine kinase [Lachnospiraceae bacterium]
MMQNAMDKLILVSDQTDRIISNVKYNIKAFSTSSALQNAINTDYPDNTYGSYLFSTAMHAAIYNIIDISSLISSGYIQTWNGQVYHLNTNKVSEPTEEMNALYEEVTSQHGKILLEPPKSNDGLAAFHLSKSLIDIDTGACLGILSFDIKEELFYDAYRNVTDGNTEAFLIADSDGNIISSQDRSLLQTTIDSEMWTQIIGANSASSVFSSENEKNLLLTRSTETENFYVVYFTQYSNIYKTALNLTILLLSVGMVVLFITILLARLLANSLIRPIIQLADYADATGNGNLGLTIAIHSNDEIGFLANRFELMNHNINELTNRIYSEQNQRREYELNLMQAQINPHFLYNCMDSISSLVTDNRNETALQMIYHLGCYYRGILSKGRNLITIHEELQMIQDYLEIQLIKTPALFTYTIRAEEELKQMKILKMLLQPIVENTIVHGFSGLTVPGQITIDAGSCENTIIIKITDDGRGIPGEMIENLLTTPSSISVPKHFGLQNVHNRIRLKFGEEYGLQVLSKQGCGTTVMIRFPKTY